MSYMKNKLFRIVVGTKQVAYEIGCGLDINNLEVLLGRRFEEKTVNTNMTAGLTICYALYGQIADFAYKPNYSTFDECKRILSISPTSKLKMYDELNILRREEINKNNNTIYSHQINYTNDKGLKISSDSFKFANNSSLANGINYRNYEIDGTGNVTKVTDNLFGSHTYTYNYRGFLVGEDNIIYEYDDNGLRTKKIISTIKESNNITKAEYNYEYDGDKLVYEKTPTCTNYYLYDENDEIYGFIQNGINKYYYVKDSLNNILGIIDDSGALVVKYQLDAYGNNISVTGNIYNPIRYKGYYFDEESNMYYCQSRYYVPELYRWLNIDNANFLEEDDINKLNLFVYCANNPVVNLDKEGFSWTSFWNNVGDGIKRTFGSFAEVTQSVVRDVQDFFFCGYETGVKIVKEIGNSEKPISFFATNASDWWKIWEYQIGVKINIGDFSSSYSIGLGETNASVSWKNSSLDFQVGVNKIGIGWSKENDSSIAYGQAYLRTIPTVLAVVLAVAAPEAIPALMPSLGGLLFI